MILAELVGAIASFAFASVLVSQPPQISRQDPQRESGSTSVENQEHEAKWKDVIHREYESGNESKLQDTMTSIQCITSQSLMNHVSSQASGNLFTKVCVQISELC